MNEPVIMTNPARCRDCYLCVRNCDVKAIRVKDHQAHVVPELCILCGTCVRVCPQGAKGIQSARQDIDQAREKGLKIIASVAPSGPAFFNMDSFAEMEKALLELGCHAAEETAIGAEIVGLAHREYVESHRDLWPIIASSCPVVVNLIEQYHPDLIPHLAPIVSPMIAHGRLRPVWLGVEVGNVSDAFRNSRGIGGVLVTDVEKDSPAAQAGLRESDVILQVDGTAVESPAEFGHQLGSFVPGDRVPLKVLRGTGELELKARAAAVPAGYAERYAERTFGLSVDVDRDGLFVARVRLNSPADEVGLRRGDRLIEVGGEKVATLADFRQAIESNLGRLPLRFLVARGGRGYIVELQ